MASPGEGRLNENKRKRKTTIDLLPVQHQWPQCYGFSQAVLPSNQCHIVIQINSWLLHKKREKRNNTPVEKGKTINWLDDFSQGDGFLVWWLLGVVPSLIYVQKKQQENKWESKRKRNRKTTIYLCNGLGCIVAIMKNNQPPDGPEETIQNIKTKFLPDGEATTALQLLMAQHPCFFHASHHLDNNDQPVWVTIWFAGKDNNQHVRQAQKENNEWKITLCSKQEKKNKNKNKSKNESNNKYWQGQVMATIISSVCGGLIIHSMQ